LADFRFLLHTRLLALPTEAWRGAEICRCLAENGYVNLPGPLFICYYSVQREIQLQETFYVHLYKNNYERKYGLQPITGTGIERALACCQF